MSYEFPDLKKVSLDNWDHPIFQKRDIRVDVLRLDKIHPDISGNKWFKLKYYLEYAFSNNKNRLISFGGPYSNHILALAAAARFNGFESVGLIRGEEHQKLSHTLIRAKEYGMSIEFLSRKEYDLQKKKNWINYRAESDSHDLWIPEGGAGENGITGSMEILSTIPTSHYQFICVAVGTGTTLAGLANSSCRPQQLIGVSVLKGTAGFEPMNTAWIKNQEVLNRIQIVHDGHFGGYAKKNETLISFMNEIYTHSGIPTDFVYTGKLFFSVVQLAESGRFHTGSRVLVLHTGGLQGNDSLSPGQLQF